MFPLPHQYCRCRTYVAVAVNMLLLPQLFAVSTNNYPLPQLGCRYRMKPLLQLNFFYY
jgi:hypothetical protein